MCEDLKVPHYPFFREIVSQIERAMEDTLLIKDYTTHLADNLTEAREQNRQWFEQRALGNTSLVGTGDDADNDSTPAPRHFASSPAVPDDELRVIIKVSSPWTAEGELTYRSPRHSSISLRRTFSWSTDSNGT